MTAFTRVTLKQRPDLIERVNDLGGVSWPTFMLHDPVAETHWEWLLETLPETQFVLLNEQDEILASGNSVPLYFDRPLAQLPDRGIHWGFQKSKADLDAGTQPNMLMAVQVIIPKTNRGLGLSTLAVQEMVKIAGENGFERVVLPVRPNRKHLFPLIPMEEYVRWQRDDGLPYDSSLRVHVKLGGEIIRVCPASAIIPGTVAQWQEWTGLEFPGSGQYLVPEALVPIVVDREADQVTYTEPNVWMTHKVP